MKYIVTLIFLCFAFAKAESQQTPYEKDRNLHQMLPLIHQADYGFSKPVQKTATVYYKSDSTGYEAKMVEALVFNDHQMLETRYIRIVGEYGSETAHNFTYDGKKLDSLNTTASSAAFNTAVNYINNEKGQLTKSIATGKYANHETTYTYLRDGNISRIHYKHKNGLQTMTDYFYKDGDLKYVAESSGYPEEDDLTTSYIYYRNGRPIFKAVDGENRAMYFLRPAYTMGIELDSDDTTKEIRNLLEEYDRNPDGFGTFMRKKFTKHDVLLSIAESKNVNFPDWEKRYVKEGSMTRFLFREVVYTDGTKAGSTKYDTFFEMRMRRR
ncbi:MAG: hypothetical protein ACSHWW_10100 [Nonlabens sp.]|uniref:hypothetical protein n=1 Tax=Nonlabens sp. TaxID=1888209 RepID=UPI003EF2679E